MREGHCLMVRRSRIEILLEFEGCGKCRAIVDAWFDNRVATSVYLFAVLYSVLVKQQDEPLFPPS